ncbi:MAG TPA: acetoacetate decarboxylase family protein [Catenuloplanes sp.]|jgi:hypothetical protein
MYPPEPWHLRGQMYVSLFVVPRRVLPPLPEPLAATVRPVLIGGRALVGAAWVRYEPGGVLQYRELLCAMLVHERGRPRVSITDIWVDSVASRDGGRALWGIPKGLAEFELSPQGDGGTLAGAVSPPSAGQAGSDPIATATITRGLPVPGRWPGAVSVAQALDGRVKRTGVHGRAGLRLGRAAWRVEPAGPLGFLAGRRPLLTVTLADFQLSFGGARPGDTAPIGR